MTQSTHPAVFPRSFRKSLPQAVRGEGVYIWDSQGERYLDFSGQAAVNFIGHGVPAISEAVAAQASQPEFVHSSQFTTAIAEEYAADCWSLRESIFAEDACISPAAGRRPWRLR